MVVRKLTFLLFLSLVKKLN